MKDKDIRILLKESRYVTKLLSSHNSRMIDEFEILQGRSRADVTIINGHLHCYEIKSSHDDLSRLPGQVVAYNKIFEYISLVSTKKHIHSAKKIIPDWWGIFCIEKTKKNHRLLKIRNPKKNKETDVSELVKLLWRDEVLDELKKRNLDKGIRTKPKKILWGKLATSINKQETVSIVRERLKNRINWRVA